MFEITYKGLFITLAWPFCFKKLDTIGKTVLAGAGFPLFIEITQLPFYARCSDIDDIIMNTTGIFIGALIYFGIKRIRTFLCRGNSKSF